MYQVSLSAFSLFLTLGTGGIPITVSRMITKAKAENNPKGESRTVGAGVCLSLLLTLPVCLFFLLFGKNVPFLFSDERCSPVFKILLIGLVFSSLYAVVRGSFWGNKQLLLPSVLEIAEESVMVIFGVLLLQNISTPLEGATKASWAVVISYFFSFALSVLCFFWKGGKISLPKRQLKPLFNATLPITSVRASSSLVNSAIAVLLPALLVRYGATKSQALELFGIVSGMVMPVLFIPSTIIGSFSLVLVPELSEDFYRKNYARVRENIKRGLKISFLIACFLIPFFYALGEDLGRLAFANDVAGNMIKNSAPILLPMCLTLISTGLLNSIGFEKQTFVHYFIGASGLLLCILLFSSLLGVHAYVLGLFVSFTLNAACNLVLLWNKCLKSKKGRGQVRVESFFTPILLSVFLSVFGQLLCEIFKNFLGGTVGLLLSALIIALISGVCYLSLGIFPFKTGKRMKIKKPA